MTAVQELEGRNAKTCVHRPDTYGYVGPLFSSDALVSEPILNRAGMLHISGSNTSVALTSPMLRRTQEPATFSRRIPNPTYYRAIATDALEGASAVAFLRQRLGGRSYFLVDDSQPYGVGLTKTMRDYAARLGLRLLGAAHVNLTTKRTIRDSVEAVADLVAARHPDGVLYGGYATFYDIESGSPLDSSLVRVLRERGYTGPILGGDPIHISEFIDMAGSRATDVYSMQPGLDPSASARPFRTEYTHRFHLPVEAYDANYFDAANIALAALYRAARLGHFRGSQYAKRIALLPYVAGAHWFGATGLTTFDRNGDTQNRIISVYGSRNHRWQFLARAPRVQVPSTN